MSKKIRVLYTISNFDTSGSGKSVYDLVKHIDRDVFEPEICCTRDDGLFFKEVEKLDAKIHIFPFKTNYRPWLSFPFRVLKIKRFFKAQQFDLIHSWNWSSDISEPLAARLAGIPYIYTKKAMGWGNKYWTWKSKLSTKIIAVNRDMMVQYFADMMDKVVRFPLAIDTEVYKPSAIVSDISKTTYFKTDDFVILSIANLVAVKGIEVLIEAVEQLNDDHIKVLIVGNDTNDYGRHLKEHYKANNNIVFAGKQLEVRPFLELADVFVIPTKDEGRREGIPNAPLEAMASECVVLGSNVSGVKDILNAFPECLFKASDVKELAEKIKEVKQMSQNDRSNLASRMRQQVIKEFSIETFLKNHETLYLSIVKQE
ncbi:Glycosyltransferase involved in cell wall bisynthesis [Formosa sp. Hel1_31_208]|uniref:glycosyltransferase family 4 protein n=1 Tax=Formosa sp. Hel1_31_208 TaxID=1798225 RepID=UPI00087971A5|nr:glycosyltransferase family 4 protein [Formosa sp. Hel1_31_208]SDS68858.1 Glycosyltransferase involved in cell wall bisynthesis [Formosa sp. Hel1_31_208]